MSKQGVVHTIKHDERYFNKLRREGAIFRHENFGAYCSTDVGPKSAKNFLGETGIVIHRGLHNE